MDMMKQASEQMKNLTPEQIDQMIADMENMNPIQKNALKAMGMNPDTMKETMQLMKNNPQMMESAQKLMQNMTPQQLMEQSRQAQERLRTMSPEEIQAQNQSMNSIPQEDLEEAVETLSKQNNEAEEKSLPTGPGTSSDTATIQRMYEVAELMSNDPSQLSQGMGGVTLAGFASLPPITLLSGDQEEDLSLTELKECWANGSLGATRVDLAGFTRVWKEVQDYFEDDILEESRKEAKNRVTTKKQRNATTPKPSTTETVQVGSSLTEDQLNMANEQFKNMSEDDMAKMFESMQNMDPATEARLRSMGTDPNMLKQTAKLMNSNPLMRKAAKEMIQNMSGADMLKVSQQAQKEMQNMTPEQMKAMMEMTPEQQEAMKNMSMEEIQQAMKGMKKE